MALRLTTIAGGLTLLVAAVALGGVRGQDVASEPAELHGMATQSGSGGSGMIMPPEPDYEAVIANEFRMARAEGTRQALIRFIARHADHRLADEARALLHGATRWRKVRSGPADPDADVYAAFDRALQTDTAEGYEEFIARHSSHPLSQEAQRLRRALLETGQDEPTQD